MTKKLYLLEDDKSIGELIVCAMEMNNIDTECFGTCAAFSDALVRRLPDVVILDIMLPDGSGLDVLRALKDSHPDLPVMMMSALGRETDKVKGLNLGADDYLSKPFGVLELSARVGALLRRAAVKDDDEAVLTSGLLRLDVSAASVTLDGKFLALNPKEFALLRYFMKNEGKVLGREKLLNAVWGYDYGGETRTVDNHVARLRKLGLEGYFTTVFGMGYKFAPPKT